MQGFQRSRDRSGSYNFGCVIVGPLLKQVVVCSRCRLAQRADEISVWRERAADNDGQRCAAAHLSRKECYKDMVIHARQQAVATWIATVSFYRKHSEDEIQGHEL